MQPIYSLSSGLLSALTFGGLCWILSGTGRVSSSGLWLAMALVGLANTLGALLLSGLTPAPPLGLCGLLWLGGNLLLSWLVFSRIKGLSAAGWGATLLSPFSVAGMNVLLGGAFGLY